MRTAASMAKLRHFGLAIDIFLLELVRRVTESHGGRTESTKKLALGCKIFLDFVPVLLERTQPALVTSADRRIVRTWCDSPQLCSSRFAPRPSRPDSPSTRSSAPPSPLI